MVQRSSSLENHVVNNLLIYLGPKSFNSVPNDMKYTFFLIPEILKLLT